MVKIKLNDFSCFALCDVVARASVMPKRMYDMVNWKNFDTCYFGVRIVDSFIKKLLGRIDDVLIVVNDNYVPVDFLIMDIECCDAPKIRPCTVIIHARYTIEIRDSR